VKCELPGRESSAAGRVDGAGGDAVRDLIRPADAAAGEYPVPAAGRCRGVDLDAGPIVDASAVGAVAAGPALPLLPRQDGGQVVNSTCAPAERPVPAVTASTVAVQGPSDGSPQEKERRSVRAMGVRCGGVMRRSHLALRTARHGFADRP
jgi:hypothetical protein